MNASEGKKFAWIQTIRFSEYSSNFWNSTPSTLNFLIDKIAVVIKGPIIIYVERGGGREKYVGKIKISVRPPLQTM